MYTQHIYNFPNGYKASVIPDNGRWEMAVLDSDGNLDYSTPVTGDVLRHLSGSELLAALNELASLPSI